MTRRERALIEGHGGGGSSSSSAPTQSPDSLRSIAYFRILDLVSEGEIGGLVNGLQSVYFDGTPCANSDGSLNFQSATVVANTGTQDQTYIPGYAAVENENSVGVELRSDTPWLQALTDTTLSAARITMSVTALSQTNTSNGDITGYTINYLIDIQTDGGAWVNAVTGSFAGKTTSEYQRSHRIDLPAATQGWNIRVTRTTANANSAYINDTTTIDSYTEIIDAKLCYPNSALIAVSGDASVFSNIPARAYDLWGRLIRVPSNYDPLARTYTGVWDGTYKTAWTNNPAWVFLDLVTHPRYGLGNLVTDAQVDKWALYAIAQYCDQSVDDGMGGQEPRFTCNLFLQTADDAYKVLSDLASLFKGIAYWAAGSIMVSADMPADASYLYTAANVIGGTFTYASSARKTRYTTALVTWNNPANQYVADVEYVQNDAGLLRYGIQPLQLTAFGCTSRGQAQRAGQWALLTSQLETETVTFSVGLDGAIAAPGQIIRVQDPARAGKRQGGRVHAATTLAITLDKAPDAVAVGDTLTCTLPTGVTESHAITAISGATLSVASPGFSVAPQVESGWVTESSTLAAQQFRVVSVTEDNSASGGNSTSENISFTITAVQNVASKYDAIDGSAIIQQPPISALPATIQPPVTSVAVAGNQVTVQGTSQTVVTISWPAAVGAATYLVQWRRDAGDWISAGSTSGTSIDVQGCYTGTYIAQVQAVSPGGITSLPVQSPATAIVGKTVAPPPPTLTATGGQLQIVLNWTWPAGVNVEDTSYTEVWVSDDSTMADGVSTAAVAYPSTTYTISGLLPQQQRYAWVRLVDKSGNVGDWSTYATAVGGTAADLFQPVQDQITQLNTDVAAVQTDVNNAVAAASAASANLQSELDTTNANVTSVQSQLTTDTANLQTQISTAQTNLQSDIDATTAQLAVVQGQVGDILQADTWDSTKAYTANYLVQDNGVLYRAVQAVPAGTALTNATYWSAIGNYSSLGAAVGATAANVATLQNTVTSQGGEIAANSQSISTQATQIAGKADTSTVTSLQNTVTSQGNTITAQGTSISAIQARMPTGTDTLATSTALNSTNATVTSQGNTITAQGTSISSLQARMPSGTGVLAAEADVSSEATTRASADSALSTQISNVSAVANNAATSSALTAEATTRASADTALGNQITSLTSTVNANTAAITTEATTRAAADSSQATSLAQMQSQAGFVFRDVFDAADPTVRWKRLNGTGTYAGAASSDAIMGGSLLTVTSFPYLVPSDRIPYDPNKLYRIRVRMRRTAGAATTPSYIGVIGFAADKVTYVNVTGANSINAQHYISHIDVVGNGFTEYVGYFKGRLTATTGQAPNFSANGWTAPGALNAGVQYIAPIIYPDYNDATSSSDVDYCIIEDCDALGQALTTNAALTTEETTRATADTALANSITALTTTVNGNTSAITAEQTARASGDQTNATAISGLTASLTTTNSNVTAAQTAANNAATAAASAAGVANGKGKVLIQSDAPAAADQLAQNLWINTTGGANTPMTWNGSAWVAVTDSAAINAANAAVAAQNTANAAMTQATTNAAAITAEQTARTTGDAALSTSLTNLSSSVTQIQTALPTTLVTFDTLPTFSSSDTGTAALNLGAGTVGANMLRCTGPVAWDIGTGSGANPIIVNYDPGKLYRIRFGVQTETTGAKIYAGVTPIKANGSNAMPSSGEWYCVANSATLADTNYHTFECWFTGNTGPLTQPTTGTSSQASPLNAPAGTVKFALEFLINWGQTASYITDVDFMSVDVYDLATTQATYTNTAAITAEATTRANADSALSTQINSVQATANNAATSAALTNEATARASADSALSTQISNVSAVANNAATSAQLTTEASTRAAADAALGTSLSLLGANNADNSAFVLNQNTVQVDGGTTFAQMLTGINATASANTTAAAAAQTTATNAAQAAASAAGIANGKADVLIQSTTPAASYQLATTLWIDTTGGANTPKRWSGSAWTVVTDKAATDAASAAAAAQAAATAAQTDATQALANINTEATTRADADTALGQRIDSVNATVGANTAAISTEQQARIDGDNANAQAIASVSASLAPGNNLVPNSAFSADDWNTSPGDTDVIWALNFNTTNFRPAQVNTYGAQPSGTPTGVWTKKRSAAIPAIPGHRYCFSLYHAAQRTSGVVGVIWHDADGNNIGDEHSDGDTSSPGDGAWSNIANYTRLSYFTSAPSNATVAYIYYACIGATAASPFAEFFWPMMEEASAAQTSPSPWSESASTAALAAQAVSQMQAQVSSDGTSYAQATVLVDANGHIGGTRLASDGTTSSFVISADQFGIVSPTGTGQRTEFSDGNWRVYDANGTLRVRMGVW